MVITITMNIQEATPAEIKGVLEQFAVFNDTKVDVKQANGSAAERPHISRARHNYNDDCVSEYTIFQMAGWDHVEVGTMREIAKDLSVPMIPTKTGHHWRIPRKYAEALAAALRLVVPRNPNAKTRIYQG